MASLPGTGRGLPRPDEQFGELKARSLSINLKWAGDHAGEVDFKMIISTSTPRHVRDVLGLIRDQRGGMTKSNRKIATAIVDDPQTFVSLPIDELAAWLDVSIPTITRFARTIGCEGLKDLKLNIMGSVQIGHSYLEPTAPPDTIADVAGRVSKRAQKTIHDLHQAIDLRVCERVINMVADCHTLYAFGSGGVSSWLIEEIQNRFFRLGVRVIPCCDHQMQLMLAATMERGDLVLCVSLSGENKALEPVLATAREYGAATAALSPSETTISQAVDELLAIDNPPDEDILSPSTLRYAYLLAIDVVAYGVAIALEAPGREKLRRVRQQVAISRAKSDVQPLCD